MLHCTSYTLHSVHCTPQLLDCTIFVKKLIFSFQNLNQVVTLLDHLNLTYNIGPIYRREIAHSHSMRALNAFIWPIIVDVFISGDNRSLFIL